jgi:hypothetical protein
MVRSILSGLLLAACSAAPSASGVVPPARTPDSTTTTKTTPTPARTFTLVWTEGEVSPDSFTRTQTYTVEGSHVRAVLRAEGSDNHLDMMDVDRDVEYTLSDEARVDAALESFDASPSSPVSARPDVEVYVYTRGCLLRPGGVERCFESQGAKGLETDDAKALAALRDALKAELPAAEAGHR